MKYRLTPHADTNIASILRFTRQRFGADQVYRYAEIISTGIEMVAAEPTRANCRLHDDLGRGVRSMHLEHVLAKRGSASHLLFFLQKVDAGGEDEVVILGVLHEAMLPRRRLARALQNEEDDPGPMPAPKQ